MPVAVPRYSVDDLDGFPNDGNRYELLDGVLLVTPAPGTAHQVIAARISYLLMQALQPHGIAYVVGPGAITRLPNTQLEPDILVYPSRFPPGLKWQDIGEHWLAVEILSPSSRVYDREFKRDAYFALGVQEVWLVDPRERVVEVCRAAGGETPRVSTTFTWAAQGISVDIDVASLFAEMIG